VPGATPSRRPRGSRAGASIATALTLALVASGACAAPSVPTAWSDPYDKTRAHEQARSFGTFGMPGDWANYGQSFADFCLQSFDFDCNRDGRQSLGADASSEEAIAAFVRTQDNPTAALADIGAMFGGRAIAAGVAPDYLPPNAAALAALPNSGGPNLVGKPGGWVATFVGVPGFIVNTDRLSALGLPIPHTWRQLTDPRYRGLVGMGAVGRSVTATMAWLAMTYAAGGSVDDLDPGVDVGRLLVMNTRGVPPGTDDQLKRGDVPIQVGYDFTLIARSVAMKAEGVTTEAVIPADGSLYVPFAVLANAHDRAHMDLAKMFLEWVLSDAGQTEFAWFGARPIRSIEGIGNLNVPADARTTWLPDDAYGAVRFVDPATVDPARLGAVWTSRVLAP
jgi:putative spermidine/putrescine transport system substrate-binding protein